MRIIVFPDKKGLTLVEVLIALVVILIISLAMMHTALLGIDSNMINVLRNEAVSVAETRMNEARSLPFTTLASDPNSLPLGADCPAGFLATFATGVLVERDFRNILGFDFCTNRTVTCPEATPCPLNPTVRQITITVAWNWKGEPYTHTATTMVTNND